MRLPSVYPARWELRRRQIDHTNGVDTSIPGQWSARISCGVPSNATMGSLELELGSILRQPDHLRCWSEKRLRQAAQS